MRWYISGPSLMMLAAAFASLRHRAVVPQESRTRVLVAAALLFAGAVALVVTDLLT